MVPRMGVEVNCFRGGNSSTSSTGSISGVYAASTRNIYGFHNLENLSTPSISDVCTASTACTRGSVLLIILPYSQHLGLQYSYCSYSQYVQYLGHHLREYCNTLSTRSTQCIEPRNAASTGRIEKKGIEHHTYEYTVPRGSIMHRHACLQ